MKIKTLFIPLFVFFLIISINLSSCKKNSDKATNSDVIEQEWDLLLTFNIVDPAVYTFFGTGDIDIMIDGDDVTISGTFTIGNLSYDDLVFEGKLNGDQFTLLTDSYQVQFEFDGVLYTETITITVPNFTFGENNVTGGGDIHILKNPGAETESGTFTFVATEK